MTHVPFILLSATMLLVAACNPTQQGSNRAADATQRAYHDMANKWRGLFTYNPQEEPPQMPQSRYCYTMQSDIVCYDSPQPNMTAKLRGYQDGANISWYQPGGGSLGASGGDPTANYQTEEVHVAPPQFVDLNGSSVVSTDPAVSGTAPFAVGESAYERNAVIANEIAAGKAAPATPR